MVVPLVKLIHFIQDAFAVQQFNFAYRLIRFCSRQFCFTFTTCLTVLSATTTEEGCIVAKLESGTPWSHVRNEAGIGVAWSSASFRSRLQPKVRTEMIMTVKQRPVTYA